MIKNFTKNQLKEKKEFFHKNGFVVFENVLKKNELNRVRKKYKKIFQGHYETGVVPDKIKITFQDQFAMLGNQITMLLE